MSKTANEFSAHDLMLAHETARAARMVPASGRFGDHKVFISALYAAIKDHTFLVDGGEDIEFVKGWLVRANRSGLLQVVGLGLARADLVGAMDPTLVAESAIELRDRDGNMAASFHFVVLP